MYTFSHTSLNDISDIKKINELCLPENYPYRLWFDIINCFPKYNFTCKKDNIIVGYLLGGNNFIDNNLNEIVIFSIAVLEEHRGNGIASTLIDLFLNQVGKKRCILQVRESNKAIILYKNLGFINESVKENYYKDGENAVIMVHRMKNEY